MATPTQLRQESPHNRSTGLSGLAGAASETRSSALAISSLPRRSAIKMVAELAPLVESCNILRKLAGTAFTDEYTCRSPRAAISTEDVFITIEVERAYGIPHLGHRPEKSCSSVYRQRGQTMAYPEMRTFIGIRAGSCLTRESMKCVVMT